MLVGGARAARRRRPGRHARHLLQPRAAAGAAPADTAVARAAGTVPAMGYAFLEIDATSGRPRPPTDHASRTRHYRVDASIPDRRHRRTVSTRRRAMISPASTRAGGRASTSTRRSNPRRSSGLPSTTTTSRMPDFFIGQQRGHAVGSAAGATGRRSANRAIEQGRASIDGHGSQAPGVQRRQRARPGSTPAPRPSRSTGCWTRSAHARCRGGVHRLPLQPRRARISASISTAFRPHPTATSSMAPPRTGTRSAAGSMSATASAA